jgi:hypothetical protein
MWDLQDEPRSKPPLTSRNADTIVNVPEMVALILSLSSQNDGGLIKHQ